MVSRRDSVSQISVPGYGVFTVRCTISGTVSAHSRTTAKRCSSQSGSAMMLIATVMPSARADLQRLDVLARRDALAVELQPLLVDRLHAEEHVAQAEPRPALEHLRVAQQDVAAGLQVVLLADAAALELAAMAMPCSGRMNATSSTMKTLGSRMRARSSAAASGEALR